jgi:S1-C subfamily serine protease
MTEIVHLIARFLYNQPHAKTVPPAQIYRALSSRDQVEIGVALHRMDAARLIAATVQYDAVRLSPEGREAWNDGSIVDQTMGMEYVGRRYGPATVHVVVENTDGDKHGGSGFFSADYPGWIVTAAHVVDALKIVSVLDREDRELAQPPFEKRSRAVPDVALIKCDCPEGLNPIRIEWRRDAVQPMDDLLVLGYLPIPGLQPGLHQLRAELCQVRPDYAGLWESLVISSNTLPGSSGGPVLSHRGRAVGIVEQENMGERLGQRPIHAFTATPARYLAELLKPSTIQEEGI